MSGECLIHLCSMIASIFYASILVYPLSLSLGINPEFVEAPSGFQAFGCCPRNMFLVLEFRVHEDSQDIDMVLGLNGLSLDSETPLLRFVSLGSKVYDGCFVCFKSRSAPFLPVESFIESCFNAFSVALGVGHARLRISALARAQAPAPQTVAFRLRNGWSGASRVSPQRARSFLLPRIQVSCPASRGAKLASMPSQWCSFLCSAL